MQLTRCLNHVSAGLQTSGTVHPSLPCWWPTNTQTHPKVPDIRRESDPAFHPARHARRSVGAHTTIHIDQGQEPQHSRNGHRPKNTSVPVGKPVEGSPSKRPCPQHIMKVRHCQAMRVQTKAIHQTYHHRHQGKSANRSLTCRDGGTADQLSAAVHLAIAPSHCQAMRVQTKAIHQTYHHNVKGKSANRSLTCRDGGTADQLLMLSTWLLPRLNVSPCGSRQRPSARHTIAASRQAMQTIPQHVPKNMLLGDGSTAAQLLACRCCQLG